MPLFADGAAKIRRNLHRVALGEKPKLVKVGRLSVDHLDIINHHRATRGLDPLESLVVFHGSHLYKSRCLGNGYSIEEVIEQISSAFDDSSVVVHSISTILRCAVSRRDLAGNSVTDELVLECTNRHPYPEIFSVIPKGDGRSKLKRPLDE